MVQETICQSMCTCCITWFPGRPLFCWIQLGRRSRAVVGYVTSWAHAFLSVHCGLGRGTARAQSALPCPQCRLLEGVTPTPHLVPFFPPLVLILLLPPPPIPQPDTEDGLFYWHSDPGVLSVCLCALVDHIHTCCSQLHRCANDLFRFFPQHLTAHPATAASFYIMSDSTVSVMLFFRFFGFFFFLPVLMRIRNE